MTVVADRSPWLSTAILFRIPVHCTSVSFPHTVSPDMPRRLSLGRLVTQSTALLMACIGTLIFALALLILFHQNATATKGYELRGLERERSMLLLEQEVLNMQIADAQSLQRLQTEEQIQNMKPLAKPRYVRIEPTPAPRKD